MPDRPLRELRDLTRTRSSVVQDKSRLVNRLQKQLEDANIKLGSVASDVMGVSGRDMIRALIDGKLSPEATCPSSTSFMPWPSRAPGCWRRPSTA